MLRIIISIALGVLASTALSGAEPAGLSPDLALGLRSAGDVTLSPDASSLAYRVDRPRTSDEPRGGSTGELWTASISGGPPVTLPDPGINARMPRWSPDGGTFSWLATRDSQAGPQINVRAVGGLSAVITAVPAGVATYAWSPDGKRIAFTATDAPTAHQVRANEEGRDWIVFGTSATQLRLYVVDVATRETVLVTRAEMSIHYFAWSPDARHLLIGAAPTLSDDDHELAIQPYVVDASGGVPRLIAPHRGRLSHVTWSRDGNWIAWLASTQISDPWAGSVFVAPADGSAAPRNLMIGHPGTATWLGPLTGSEAAVVIEEGQSRALHTVDLATGRMEIYSRPAVVLTGSPTFSRDGSAFASAASSATHPSEVFFGTRRQAGQLRRMTTTNPQLAGVQFGTQEVTRWKSKDGLTIEGVLVKPVGFTPGVRYPVIVHVHGGSEGISVNGWLGSYIDWGQLLAARGYVVIYPNYRGSRGRGVDFVRGNRHDLMGREWEDIESSLDHVVAMGIGDSDRAGIYGFSWGGYAAGWGATYASKRFKAAVAGAGIYNWISEAGSNDTRMHEQLAHWDEPLYENFLLYLERSPIYQVGRATTPLLMLHGEEDPSCPVGQAIEMHTALKWKGVPVELVIYPREGHGMREPAHQRDYLTRGLSWLETYLK